MSRSREEVEKIVTEFDVIAARDVKKPSKAKTTYMIGFVTICLIVLFVAIYLLVKNNKSSAKKSKKSVDAKPAADAGNNEAPAVAAPNNTVLPSGQVSV